MKDHILLILLAVVLYACCTMPAGAQEFKEGQWTITMTTKMDNMPAEMAKSMEQYQQQMANLPPEAKAKMESLGIHMNSDGQGGISTTITHCMTKKNPVPKYTKDVDKNNCQQTHDINGNTVHFHTTCSTDDMQMDAAGDMTYEGDSMQGHIKSHMVKNGKTIDSTVDMTGQYLGPCP